MNKIVKDGVVWAVIHTWATEDETDDSVHIFGTYEKAKKEFDAIVSDEKESDWYKYLPDKVETEEEDYWDVCEDGNYSFNHSCVRVERQEIVM